MLEKIFSTLIVLVYISLSATLTSTAPEKLPDVTEPPTSVTDNDNSNDDSSELPTDDAESDATDTPVDNGDEPANEEIADNGDTSVQTLPYTDCLTLTNTYPHRDDSFTQGLFFYDGGLYETTGRYAESKIYKNINLENGIARGAYAFPDTIFAEGASVLNDKLYVLTYKEEQVQVFDPVTLEHITTYSYPRQGWGLTSDGEYLIASDGTSTLYFFDEDMKEQRRITVTKGKLKMENINELEYINGEIWANQWLSNRIIVIDPENGNVKRAIDMTGLFTPASVDPDAVLNGIAYNDSTDKIYITGKLWETLFEFSIK